MMPRDSWLTHYSHYLASCRGVIYGANMLKRHGNPTDMERTLLDVVIAKATKRAGELESTIRKVYKGSIFSYLGDRNPDALGQNYGLFARVVDGSNRCSTLHSWLKVPGSDNKKRWPGDEEKLFHTHLHPDLWKEQVDNQFLFAATNFSAHTPRHGITSGIMDIKYTFKTLSDMGFIELALEKASSKLRIESDPVPVFF
jgi:hypothetical protein